MPFHKDILAYNAAQSAGDNRICNALAKAIDRKLPDAENKIWHRHPVWFLDGNPIVGYSSDSKTASASCSGAANPLTSPVLRSKAVSRPPKHGTPPTIRSRTGISRGAGEVD